jgi:arylsulfatase A-like enzyme
MNSSPSAVAKGLTLLLMAAVLFPFCGREPASTTNRVVTKAGRRPHVIWVLLDTARADFSCYGFHRETSPNIDRLASTGVLFENHFSQALWTADSVPSYMTGRYFPAQSLAINGNFEPEVRLAPASERLLPEVFRENGYQTAMFTTDFDWFSEQSRLYQAFDDAFLINPKMPPLASFAELNSQIFPYLARAREKPLFLYVHAWDAHFPHHLEPPYDRWLDKSYDARHLEQANSFGVRRSDGEPFSEADKQHLRGLYDGSILYADAQIGRLFDRLKELGLFESSLIVISSDHGEALGEDGRMVSHGGFKTYDEITHVPFILSGPGLPSGRRIQSFTENADIFSTLVDLLGLETRAESDGRSLVPLVFGANDIAERDFVFSKRENLLFSLRTRQFRYDYDLETHRDALYPVPDRIATRVNVIQRHEGAARRLRERLFSDIVPLWEASQRTPLLGVFLPCEKLLPTDEDEISRRGVVLSIRGKTPTEQSTRDDKWLLHEGQLFAASFSEDVPPLALQARVRDGEYSIMAQLRCDADLAGNPASSFSVRVEDDEEARLISCSREEMNQRRFVFRNLGVYTIQNGTFDVQIDDGEPGHWLALRQFVLVGRSAEAQREFKRLFSDELLSQEDVQKRREQLEALGYL